MGDVLDRLWKNAVLKRIPLTGAFELLPICNLQCKMCYVRKTKAEVDADGGLILAGQWLDWAEQSRDLGMLFPLLTGGEPFLRQDLFEILSGLQQLGMQPSINSNGTLIDETTARWLGKHKPRRINITLYGASEESYQTLCGNGNAFNQVHNAVKWLKEYDVPFKFNASITTENVNDMEEMISYAKSVNRPIEVATYMFPPVRRDVNLIGKNNRLSPEEAGMARVKADWLQADSSWFRGQAMRFSTFVPMTDETLKRQESSPAQGMSCRAGRASFWIDWQGNIVNCGMYASSKHSMKGITLAEAWERITEETDAVRYSPACTNCPNFHLCHTCIAMVMNECGTPDGRPDYLCRMNAACARYYAEYAIKLPQIESVENVVFMKPDALCDMEN